MLLSICAYSQETKKEKTESKGKAIIQVFGNFHTGFGENKDDRGFEIERSYLGYQYSFGNGFTVQAVMDVGKTDAVNDYHRIAYLKNAFVSWNRGKFTIAGGLIPITQFNLQEKFWGYRYINKSFQDKYKFGNSTDLGISAAYKFTKWLSADAIIVNGEGYKKIQVNDGLLYGVGLTINPVKQLTMRVYGGINEGDNTVKTELYNVATFIGYKMDKFSVAAEYNLMMNSGYVTGRNQYGVSAYSTVKLNKITNLYARYDNLMSNNAWNIDKDEQSIVAGLEVKLHKFVKLAPNFRMSIPKAAGARNVYMGYISCSFGI